MAKCNHEFTRTNKDLVCIHCNWNKSQFLREKKEHSLSGIENLLSVDELNKLDSALR